MAKALKELMDEDIEAMSTEQLAERLMGLNPFGGYSPRGNREVLVKTLKNYRDRG